MIRGRDEDEEAGGAFELQHDLQLVRYFIEIDEETGEIGPLKREHLKDWQRQAAREEVELEATALSHRIKYLRLEYRVGEEWSESWRAGGLPPAVRITLGTRPLPEGTEPDDYPYETIWREVALAGASQSQGADAAPAGRRRASR